MAGYKCVLLLFVVRRPTMAHLQNWFGLLSPQIATILPWSESLHKPVSLAHAWWRHCMVQTAIRGPADMTRTVTVSNMYVHVLCQCIIWSVTNWFREHSSNATTAA